MSVWEGYSSPEKWKGHRLFAIDGLKRHHPGDRPHNEKGVIQKIQANMLLLNLARISEDEMNKRKGECKKRNTQGNHPKLTVKKRSLFLIIKWPLLIPVGINNVLNHSVTPYTRAYPECSSEPDRDDMTHKNRMPLQGERPRCEHRGQTRFLSARRLAPCALRALKNFHRV